MKWKALEKNYRWLTVSSFHISCLLLSFSRESFCYNGGPLLFRTCLWTGSWKKEHLQFQEWYVMNALDKLSFNIIAIIVKWQQGSVMYSFHFRWWFPRQHIGYCRRIVSIKYGKLSVCTIAILRTKSQSGAWSFVWKLLSETSARPSCKFCFCFFSFRRVFILLLTNLGMLFKTKLFWFLLLKL